MKQLKNNWAAKLVSLILAIILWSFVIGSENPTIKTTLYNVPITIENSEKLDDKGLVLMNDYKKYTDVTVKGKRNQILNITSSHIRVIADVDNFNEGTHLVKMKYEFPEGVSLANAPLTIDLDIQKIIKKDFQVMIENKGELGENYILESIVSSPEKITAVGPRSIMENVEKIVAEFDLDGVTNNIVTNVNVYPVDKNNKFVNDLDLGQNFVNLNATILEMKEVEIKPSTINDLSDDIRLKNISIIPNKLYIKGNVKEVDKVDFLETENIDLSKIRENKIIDIKLKLPDNILLASDKIDIKANIEIDKMEDKEMEIPLSNIIMKNLSEDRKVEFISKDKFKVRLKGYEEDLRNLKISDLTITMDMKGKIPGDYTLTPSVKNDKIRTVSVEDIRLKIIEK